MEISNMLEPLEIKSVDSEPKTTEELLAERQQHIRSALPQLFEVYKESDGSILVHCLKPDVREALGDSWFRIVRDFISRGYGKCTCDNLADEEQ